MSFYINGLNKDNFLTFSCSLSLYIERNHDCLNNRNTLGLIDLNITTSVYLYLQKFNDKYNVALNFIKIISNPI